ncbi:MAG TPA: hypothetical protein VGL97_17035 [Bryobacteraceae bacterium]
MIAEPQSTVVAIRITNPRSWLMGILQSGALVIERVGVWAGDTAQQFGALVSALMGPAVFSAYAFAVWSLAANLGWTDSFIFTTGALSNWLVWLSLAIAVNVAAGILRRHSRLEE